MNVSIAVVQGLLDRFECNQRNQPIPNSNIAIQTKVQTTLRSIIGEMDLDNALSSRDQIKTKLTDTIATEIEEWGISLRSVEIQDINPSQTMQQAMEEQASAERWLLAC